MYGCDEVDNGEIGSAIRSLKPGKAAEADKITTEIIKCGSCSTLFRNLP